jgi:hypothetical protein
MHRGTVRSTPSTLALGTLAIALGTLATGATGCLASGGDESMLVLKNVMPASGCTFSPAETETGITHGALDVQGRTGYLFTAQIKSRVTADAGQQDQRTILITGANVDIAFPGSMLFTAADLDDLKARTLTHFKSLFASPLTPNGGLLDAQFELIPAELAAAIAARKGFGSVVALATFKVVGAFPGDDSEQTSQAYQYPVTIVEQGLVVDRGPCAQLATAFMPRTGNACNPVQDFVVDCCSNATVRLCPAVGTAM